MCTVRFDVWPHIAKFLSDFQHIHFFITFHFAEQNLRAKKIEWTEVALSEIKLPFAYDVLLSTFVKMGNRKTLNLPRWEVGYWWCDYFILMNSTMLKISLFFLLTAQNCTLFPLKDEAHRNAIRETTTKKKRFNSIGWFFVSFSVAWCVRLFHFHVSTQTAERWQRSSQPPHYSFTK